MRPTDRIRAVAAGDLMLDGGAPVALPRGVGCWQVARGTVEVYLSWPGGRRLLAVREAGGMLFGADADLLLVAIGSAHLIAGGDEDIASAADAWVRECASRTRADDPSVPTVTIDAPGPHRTEDGQVLTAGDVLWLTPAAGVALSMGDGAPVVLSPDTVPIGPGCTVGVKGRGDVLARPGALMEPDQLQVACAVFVAGLPAVFDRMSARVDDREQARLATGSGSRAGAATATTATAMRDAATMLGVGAAGLNTDGAVPLLARRLGLRARKIVLEPGWHRLDHGVLIVAGPDGSMALTRRGGGYRTADGTRIGATVAARVEHGAWVVSAPLPDGLMRLWRMARFALSESRRDVIQTGLAAGGVAGMGVLVPLATGWLLSDIVPSGMLGLLIAVGIALAFAAAMSAFLSALRARSMVRIGGRAAIRLASALSDRVLRLPAAFFKDYAAGDLNQRLQNVDQMRDLAVSIALSAGLTAVLSVVYLVTLFFYDPALALMAVALVSVYILAVVLARVMQMAAIREAARLDGEIAGLTFETLEGVGKLRLAAAEDRAMRRWQMLYRQERDAAIEAGRVSAHFAAFSDTYQTITLMTLFAAATWFALMETPAGIFIAFLAAFGAFQGAFVGLSQTFLQVYAAQPLMERARPILEAEIEQRTGNDPGRLSGAIEAAGISFAYGPGLAPVLDGLDFEVRPGEHMAIVGGSGSGKSTLLRLLLGFETPQTGAITFDGQDLARLDLTAVRSQIGVVLQASQLFAGSILDNIRGAGSADLEACMTAAHRAGLARDLEYFAMGLHTPITEGGSTLSGGQRQRILIARALASDPRILFFDEATSALDNATQAQVAATLDAMKITRITIAHRLSTVRNADRICVLQAGRFVEQGTFEELMTRNGVFAELARRQLTGDEAGPIAGAT